MKKIEVETQLKGETAATPSGDLTTPSIVQQHHHHHPVMTMRRGSFSEVEAFFLHKLLVDDDPTPATTGNANQQDVKEEKETDHIDIEQQHGNSDAIKTKKVFDDNILFTVPPPHLLQNPPHVLQRSPTLSGGAAAKLPASHKKARRRSTVGLWQAYAQGVSPSVLRERGSRTNNLKPSSSFQATDLGDLIKQKMVEDAAEEAARAVIGGKQLFERHVSSFLDDDANSEEEVRPDKKDNVSVTSSWDERDNHEQFDTWEVLKDEYASDFGFDYKSSRHSMMEDEDQHFSFQILGTGADDVSSRPHVLSPPLMDALMNFLPIELQGENFWMRYSLVRDGASLDTLKEYVRAATFTLLAIETPNGQVFGSFTSSPWRNHLGFFGGKPAFVWKMRHGRRVKCASLFDQAQLESEIDVYICQNSDYLVQVCRHDALAVGGDDGFVMPAPLSESSDRDTASPPPVTMERDELFNVPAAMEDLEDGGFAIALEEDLMCGTTSPSRTFTSPALYGPGDRSQFFDVAGLEIWSFTPCIDVKNAEKLEMTKYFIEESFRGSTGRSSTSERSWNSRDLTQNRFYRRVGEDYESEERRQRWQYVNMMNPGDGASRGFGATPRFVS